MNERKTALSLPYSYLAGHPVSERDSILMDIFGPAEKFLPEISNKLSGIEISHFNGSAPADQVVSSVRTIKKAGLEVVLHPHLPFDINGKQLNDAYPWIESVMDEVSSSGQTSLLLNIHSLSSEKLEIPILIEKTVENLKKILEMTIGKRPAISIAVEINREKGIIDPSTRYENLVEICRRVDHPAIGIGWDLGHTYSNVLRGLILKNPPKDFVERIFHTHIHDLGRDSQTHWPLTVGTLPLDFYLEQLKSVDYRGYYTLEIYPERFRKVLPAREKMLESIDILQQA